MVREGGLEMHRLPDRPGLDVRLLEWLAKLSTVEALEALQELEQAVYYLRWKRRIEAAMANMPSQLFWTR